MSCSADSPRSSTIPNKKNKKLRASCDACNESKGRCSQTKPTCVRYEKQDIQCIYGLSRRTHKDAPRVGAPVSSSWRNSISSGLVQQEPTPAETSQHSQSEESIFASLDLAHQRTDTFIFSPILDLSSYETDTSMTAPPNSGAFLDMTNNSDTQVHRETDCFNLPPMLQLSPFHIDSTMMTPLDYGDIPSLFNSSSDDSSTTINSTPPSTEPNSKRRVTAAIQAL
ncbi:hypothetical protein HYALB_00011436 [Hymenoscyphus albidus]|uniref:Zn(2)-C6 fungal-type domain-containing protein n=1 Tax=Hymenoscyphus albidus TaxID=595503 RepID=A0A9N9LVC6_9HELO|nr:hypothetical protein HYALB_00011436 [Hymenoscyphus albidus]